MNHELCGPAASARDQDMSKARTTALFLVGTTVAFVLADRDRSSSGPGAHAATRSAHRGGSRAARQSVSGRCPPNCGCYRGRGTRITCRPGCYGSAWPAADVRSLNQHLFTLHFLPGPGSSEYTTTTLDAVIAFQKWAGITRDGTAGPQTQKRQLSGSPAVQRPGSRWA